MRRSRMFATGLTICVCVLAMRLMNTSPDHPGQEDRNSAVAAALFSENLILNGARYSGAGVFSIDAETREFKLDGETLCAIPPVPTAVSLSPTQQAFVEVAQQYTAAVTGTEDPDRAAAQAEAVNQLSEHPLVLEATAGEPDTVKIRWVGESELVKHRLTMKTFTDPDPSMTWFLKKCSLLNKELGSGCLVFLEVNGNTSLALYCVPPGQRQDSLRKKLTKIHNAYPVGDERREKAFQNATPDSWSCQNLCDNFDL